MSSWTKPVDKNEVMKIFEDVGPMQGLVNNARNCLSWFVSQIFCNTQGKPLRLEPFQMVMLNMLWYKKFPMIIGCRGCGKTWCLALYCLLRAMLIPGSKIVICGAGYRQAKLVFKYIQTLYECSPVVQESIKGWGGPKYGSDAASFKIGLSDIIAIPIGDGDKIRGLRACVDPNTLIETDKGLMRISDSFKRAGEFKVFTGIGQEIEEPSLFIKTKPIDAYKIKTIGNYEFICSDIHQVYTTNGFKTAKDLRPHEDYLLFENNYIFPKEYIKSADGSFVINEEIGWLLGLLVSEGSVGSKHSLSIHMTEKNTVLRAREIFQKLELNAGFYEHKERIDLRGWTSQKSYETKICNKKFREKLYELGLERVTARFKKIPWCILQSPESVVRAFLSGLFHGDGSAFLYKDKQRDNNFGITYYTGSKQLSIDVQTILAKFNIFATRGYRTSKLSTKIQYHIRMYGKNVFKVYDILDVPKWADIYKQCDKTVNHTKQRTSLVIKSVEKLSEKRILYDYLIPNAHSFMGNGFRQHNSVLICDEFGAIPEETFEIVLSPFTSVHTNPAQRAAIARFSNRLKGMNVDQKLLNLVQSTQDFGNQIVISGTATYKYNHLYKRFKTYKTFIESKGNREEIKRAIEERSLATAGRITAVTQDDVTHMARMWEHYAVMQLPYTALPENFLDEDTIRSNKASFSSYRFMQEYLAQFPDDSDGFIKRSSIEQATPYAPNDIPVTIELYGDPRCTYVMGVDPARWNDNLAIAILKLTPRGKEFVYCAAWDRKEFGESARRIRDICQRFNIQYIAMDKGGGGDAIQEWLCKKQDGLKSEELIWPIPDQLERIADLSSPGKKILDLINFAGQWSPESAHALEAAINQRNLLFPYKGEDSEVAKQYMRYHSVQNISEAEKIRLNIELWGLDDWDAKKQNIDPSVGVFNNINECLNETCAIIKDTTEGGTERFILPRLADQPEGLDMRRRDRFSALMLANYAAKCLQGHGNQVPNPVGLSTNFRRGLTQRRFRRRGSVAY